MKVMLFSPSLKLGIKYVDSILFSKVLYSEGSATPPIGLAYIATSLEEANHIVKIVDLSVENLNKKQILNLIFNFNPSIIGLSMNSFNLDEVVSFSKLFKNNFREIPIVIGGPQVNIFPKESLRIKNVDFAIYGEGEDPMVDLVNALEKNEDYSSIKNLVFRRNGKIIVNKARPLKNLDDLPFPAYHLLDIDKYKYFFLRDDRFVVVFISRGCPYRCPFCFMGLKDYRLRSVESVVKEIKKHYVESNIKTIHFYDDSFTANKKWVHEFTNAIMNSKMKIKWSCLARLDDVDEALLKKMSQAGCFLIRYGVESGDPGILKSMNKLNNIKEIYRKLKLTKKYGIITFGFFMVGVPGESKRTIKNTLSLISNADLDFIRVSKFIAMPKTKYYMDYVKKTGDDFWSEIFKGKTKNFNKVIHDVQFTGKKINKIVKKMYLRFYLRSYLQPRHSTWLLKSEKMSLSRAILYIRSIMVVLLFFLTSIG